MLYWVNLTTIIMMITITIIIMIMIIIFTVIIMMMMEEHFYSLDNSKLLLASLLSPHNRNLQLKCHFIPTNTTTNYCHLNYNNNGRG